MLRRVLALQASHTVEHGRGMNRVYREQTRKLIEHEYSTDHVCITCKDT